ncbi:MAG: metal ABC transporter permease [Pseudomonadota bacterium]
MLDDFYIRALLAGLGVAAATGPLGCFVVWRRMAYFGDATAHAAILGVAIALPFSISLEIGVLAAAFAMAIGVAGLSGRGLSADTLLGVAAHAGLAVGLVALALAPNRVLDVEALLFGEILAVSVADLALIWGGGALIAGLLIWRWRRLITATISAEMAWAEGVDPKREQMVLTIALALVVAVAIKVVGALLITAMLIIPAAAARPLARTPEAMAVAATAIGAGAVWAGLEFAWAADAPAGPSIVAAAVAAFALTLSIGGLIRRAR